jgi:asparagine synthase (glutamine-hydrolysing)
MCGIAGFVGPSSPDGHALEEMAGAMARRGPDGQGTWWDGQAGLGFRRLAIIDLDERSNQPFHLGGLHLVFNGEIYNYLELREEMLALGHHFLTEGDAEVLLHAWEQWGEGALERFEGMFAFAIWDERRRRLTLAVDRFAEKPLYYHQREERLLFASSVSALRASDAGIGVPDERAIEEFLALGTIPTLPSTFFGDVSRLPPATVARWELGRISTRRYWTPRRVPLPEDPRAVATLLRELLFDSIRLRLRSDVPVGSSLSGGVDSSAIVSACARLAGGQPRHAFTATFPGFARDEWSAAHQVAQGAGVAQHHAVAPRVEELLDDLQALVSDQEEPFISTSIYAQWRVMRAAREAGVIVLLDGQGADELFGGYLGTGSWALRAAGPRVALTALARNPAIAKDLAIAYTAGRAPRALTRHHRLRRASPYVTDVVAQAAAEGGPAYEDSSAEGSPLRRELLSQAFRTSLPNLCRYADRDSMAHSVEVRMPFLDSRIAELAFSLPTSLVFCDGVTKRALRDSLRGLVPDRILDRREKVGYETPEEVWFNTPVARRRLAEIVLDPDARASGRYDATAVERDLASGAWSDVNGLWRAVNVELWLASTVRSSDTARQAA